MVREALSLARRVHADESRDDGNGPTPFMDHLLAVGNELARDGYPEGVVAAGLLHDTVESGGLEIDDVRGAFGDSVAHLVDALSERPEIDAYAERKDDLRRRVAHAGPDAQAIYAADKLSNMRALRDGYAVRGEAVDAKLKVSLDEKVQVWEADLEMLAENSPGVPVVDRLAEALAGLRSERASARRG